MYYVVTGAAGFIGSKLVEGLNRRGITEIIAVDNLAHADIGSAVRIANKAAGIVVGKLGTAVVHPDELG